MYILQNYLQKKYKTYIIWSYQWKYVNLEGEISMNIKIVSKDLIATDAIKDYIGKKSERLVKYFGEDFAPKE